MSDALIELKGFGFSYPDAPAPALQGIDLEVASGSCVFISGPIGSGKSTLLRCLQPALAPAGEYSGVCKLKGRSAFVQQDPRTQAVSDQVRRELAFGLRNLKVAEREAKSRMARAVSYFGMDPWLDRPLHELSYGQLQTLNLAAALVLQPDLLLLDEPLACLDPVATRRFCDLLWHLRQEHPCTLLITGHDPYPLAGIYDRIYDLGSHVEKGEPSNHSGNSPFSRGEALKKGASGTLLASSGEPALRADGRWFCPGLAEPGVVSEGNAKEEQFPLRLSPSAPGTTLLTAKHLGFRYGKDKPWVLKDLSLSLEGGQIAAVTGGNGCGKSTLLYTLAGGYKPQAGHIKKTPQVQVTMLPQEVQSLFTEETVAAELHGLDAPGLTGCLDRHPLDLSVGGRQLLALELVMSRNPNVLLLDEPTFGLDATALYRLGERLQDLRARGMAILLATHNRTFADALADRHYLLFDGELVSDD
jgi:energy-coupling factor transport system ATP-binding protein